jgi:hypothetical protein
MSDDYIVSVNVLRLVDVHEDGHVEWPKTGYEYGSPWFSLNCVYQEKNKEHPTFLALFSGTELRRMHYVPRTNRWYGEAIPQLTERDMNFVKETVEKWLEGR